MEKRAIPEGVINSVFKDTVTTGLLIAAIDDLEARSFWIDEAQRHLFRVAAGEFSGNTFAIKNKLTVGIIDACIKRQVIKKKDTDIHALVHGIMGALDGLSSNIGVLSCVKINYAVVRKDGWITVAFIGFTGFQSGITFKNCGVGTMHIGSM